MIRFTNQENALDIPGATWGPMRVVFLQYASDPITFFDPQRALAQAGLDEARRWGRTCRRSCAGIRW